MVPGYKNVVDHKTGGGEPLPKSWFWLLKCRRSQGRRPGTDTQIIVWGCQNVVDHEAGGWDPAEIMVPGCKNVVDHKAGGREPLQESWFWDTKMSYITRQAAGNATEFMVLGYQK